MAEEILRHLRKSCGSLCIYITRDLLICAGSRGQTWSRAIILLEMHVLLSFISLLLHFGVGSNLQQ